MPFYMTQLADVLRNAGLVVVECDGWQDRGFRRDRTDDGRMESVQGIVWHHTAGGAANAASLGTILNGRSDVPPPLANLLIARDGTIYVVAAGRANHAGRCRPGYGNSTHIGIEIENRGDGVDPYLPQQMAACVTAGIALGQEFHFAPDANLGHKEVCWPPGRKIDPSFDMDEFRSRLAHPSSTAAKPQPTKPKGTSMFVIKTLTPWGADAYVLVTETCGARALDDLEAQAYAAMAGHFENVSWDLFNLLIRQAWERRNEFLTALGHTSTMSAADAVQQIIDALKGLAK